MPYFRVDDGFNTHPKVLAIPRRDRVAAVGLWTMAGVHCALHLTDGRVGKHMVEELGSSKKYADHLVRVGLWRDEGDAYCFHEFVPWQGASREEVLAKREAEAERKRRWRAEKDAERAEKRAQKDTAVPDMSQRDNPRTDTGTTASVPASVRPESEPRPALPPLPSPPHPDVPYGDIEDGSPWGENDQRADARANDEPPLCRRHAGQDRDSVPPCTACARLREQWEAAQSDHRPPPLPPLCGECDARMVENPDGSWSRCPRCHPAALALTGS